MNKARRLWPAILKTSKCIPLLLTLLIFSSLPTAESRPPTFQEIGVRNAHAMAYDSDRRRVVLFGGADESKVCGDTWEWDGKRWTRVNHTGPGPRTFPAMAYDSVRRRLVLFGGNRVLFGKSPGENKFLNDTWEWDGRRWTEIKVTGPSPRAEAAIAFDEKRGRVMLFGGHNRAGDAGSRLGDTWEWDGKTWTEIKVPGPSPRNGAAQVYDSGFGKIVLFGGSTREAVSGETWTWDGKKWVEDRAAVTEGRFNCVMAYDDARHKIIRFGGRYAGKPLGDTWEYDAKGWMQLALTGPTARNHAAVAYDSKRTKIVLFGGHDFGVHDGVNIFGDTWEWDGSNWVLKKAADVKRGIDNGH
ncbi:MAG: kelch repeat-containing protein [Pyrinomonadaceae bacterium]